MNLYLVQYATNSSPRQEKSAVVRASSMFEAQAKFFEAMESKFKRESTWKIELSVEGISEIE
jgi:hypothetical protein